MSGSGDYRQKQDAERQRQALKDLERLEREAEVVGQSQMRRTAEKTRDHFMGKDADESDQIEVWGKRIARGLALVFVLYLIFSLTQEYLL